MSINTEQLLERSIKAQEQTAYVSQSLLEVSKRMEDNLKTLNDNFVLHDHKNDKGCQDICDVKNILIKYLKISIIALIIAVGGASVIKLLLDAKIF